MRQILIVESEPRRAALLEEGFTASGYVTSTVADSRTARTRVQDGECDLLVIDSTGLDVHYLDELRAIAERQRLPVVFITTAGAVEGRLVGPGLANQDYVEKPFHFDALLARVHGRLERDTAYAALKLAAGPLEIDAWTRRARIGGVEVPLTGREFTLLEFLMRHPGELVSRAQLHTHVWGYEHDPCSNVIEVYIGYLRRKLGIQVIETIHGKGYRLNV